MRIAIAFKPPLRRWQQRLVDKLICQGHEVVLRAGALRRLGLAVNAALAVESRVFGPRPSLFEAAPTSPPTTLSQDGPGWRADLVIALDGAQVEAPCIIEPIFDGGTGDVAMIAMLVAHPSERCVEVRLQRRGETFDCVTAHFAIQDPEVLSRALDQACARLVTLLLQAVRRLQSELRHAIVLRVKGEGSGVPIVRASSKSPLAHVANAFLQRAAARLPGMKRGPSHWRIAFRRLGTAQGLRRDAGWPDAQFTILPDDGRRFYADPVPFEHEDRRFIFLEDFPYATGKAVIAVSEIDADGKASPPRTVLEHPCHLSYPFLLRHNGEIYMLPEMSGAGRVQLFRADPFPDRWVADQVLLDDTVAADATLIEHDGRWWMFATLSDDGGSSWDQLCLFHAPDLFGPWTAHADNPVLVDAGAARPAGAMWEDDGGLMRVAQDCRDGYGRGLAICRVDRLDEMGYAQTVMTRLGPPDGYGADGVHTLDRAGGLEVIDLRFPAAGR